MPESIQHKLDRVRRPRVQITYDVETLGSIVKTELPFVVGIMADLSGNGLERADADRKNNAKPLKDRKYVEIDRDSFDTIMAKVKPQVNLLGYTDPVAFESLDDFNPMNVLLKLPDLKAKFESRTRLSNLVAKLDGNPQLQEDLMNAINNLGPDEKAALKKYVQSYLLGSGKAEAEGALDLTKLTEDEQDEVRMYIVKNFPETTTPGLKALAASLSPDDQKKLTTYVLKNYALSFLDKLADADKTALLDFIGKLDDPSVAAKPAADPNAPPPDPKAMVDALNAANKKKVKGFVGPKLTAAVTAADLTVLDRLGPYEKDEVKAYAVASLKSAKVVPVGEGGIDKLEDLVDALNADDRQKFDKHVADQYPATVSKGGTA